MIRETIKTLGGPLLSICLALATPIGLAFSAFGEEFRKKYSIEVLTLYLHWVVIFYLIWLCFHLYKSRQSLPIVKSRLNSGNLLLVEPKDWMGIDVGVLIFLKEADYERHICAGQITNIQLNGLVQITVFAPEMAPENGELENVASLIMTSEMRSLIIKPGRAR